MKRGLFLILGFFVLFELGIVFAWEPPIGIPRPEFWIEESYRMYDIEANRNPSLLYAMNEEGGFYTHYVDNSVSCIDSGNPYGTAANPRCTIPTIVSDVPEGSVVEIHGEQYNKKGFITLNFVGTKEKPIFIRGYSQADKPVFNITGGFRVGGRYTIIENLALSATAISFHYSLAFRDHISIRNIEAFGPNAAIGVGNIGYTVPASQIVFYNNYIHDTAIDIKGDTDTPSGNVGIAVNSNSNHIWVVDNHVHRTGSDSFHSGHACVNIDHVYIGRNEFHHDKENAIDIKAVRDFIISENKIYGYRGSCSSGADAIRVNDEGEQDNIWIIFNEIYDSDVGIAPYGAIFRPYVIGNLIYDTPVFGISDDGDLAKGSTVVHNTFYDVGTAIKEVKDCSNNIISGAKTNIAGDCNPLNNIFDEGFANMPEFCERISYYQYHSASAVLSKTELGTRVQVPGVNFESMGVEYNDRISVEFVPEVKYVSTTECSNGCLAGGTSTKPICSWQRVGSVSGDTITLKRDIGCPGITAVGDVDIRIWYYPDTNNEFSIDDGFDFQAGDIIEYNYDGVPRTISQVLKNSAQDLEGNLKDKIIFNPAISEKIEGDTSLCNWRNNDDLNRNLRIKSTSLAIDAGTSSDAYALFYNNFYADFAALNSAEQLNIAVDAGGVFRPQGVGWDIGAYEYQTTSCALTEAYWEI